MGEHEGKKQGSESKKKIVKAALDVVARYSISGTRMHLIADEAGMSSANLHYHFETKDELLTGLLQDVQQAFTRRRSNCLDDCGDTLESHLRAFFQNKINQIRELPEYDQVEFDYWVTSQSDEKIRQLLQEDFHSWHSDLVCVLKGFSPELSDQNAQLIGYTMISLMKGCAMQYLLNPSFDLEDYFELCLLQIMCSVEHLTGKEEAGQSTPEAAAQAPAH